MLPGTIRLRHRLSLPLAVAAALGAVAGTSAAATLPDAAPASPLDVNIGQVQCLDLTAPSAAAPRLAHTYGANLRRVPTVDVDVQNVRGAKSVPYTITVDGQQKATGNVGPRAHTHQTVSLTNAANANIVISSGKVTVLVRTVQAHC